MLSAIRLRRGSAAKLEQPAQQLPTQQLPTQPLQQPLQPNPPQPPAEAARKRMPSAGRAGIDLRGRSPSGSKPHMRSGGKLDFEALVALRNAAPMTCLDPSLEPIESISASAFSYNSMLISRAQKLFDKHTELLSLADKHQDSQKRYDFMCDLQNERIQHYCKPDNIFAKICEAINKLEQKSSEDPELNKLREAKKKLADQYKAMTIAFDCQEKAVANDPPPGFLDHRITGLYEFQKMIRNELERLAIRADIFVPFQRTGNLQVIDPERSAYGAIRSCYPFKNGTEQREKHYIDAVNNYSAQEPAQVNELVTIAGDVIAAVSALSNSLKKFDSTPVEEREEMLMNFLLSIQTPYDDIIAKLNSCKCFPSSLVEVLVKMLEGEKQMIEILIQNHENEAFQKYINSPAGRNSAAKLDEVTQQYSKAANEFYSALRILQDEMKSESTLNAVLADLKVPLVRSESQAAFDGKLDTVLANISLTGSPASASPQQSYSITELIENQGFRKSTPEGGGAEAERREFSAPAQRPS
jgi:hypothetical protein